MIVLGLDVSRLSVMGCLLMERPKDPRQFYRTGDFFSASLQDKKEVQTLLDKQPDVAVLEPTGTHYSLPWIQVFSDAGVEVRLVGHDKLRAYRQHLDLPDKNDRADALALACYCFDYWDFPLRFVPVRDSEVSRVRDIAFRLNFYARLRNPCINRLKQDLVKGFPDKAKYSTSRDVFKDSPPLWRWMAGDLTSGAVFRGYEEELMNSIGGGITNDMVFDSQLLVKIFRRERDLELELAQLLEADRFLPYLSVFEEFRFGPRILPFFLSQMYPFSKFMGPDGLPEVRKERGQNGKFTNRYLSLRRFKSMMGLAPKEKSSGSRNRVYLGGNRLCRRLWWQWLFTSVHPQKSRTTATCLELGKMLDDLKAGDRPMKVIEFKVCAKACELLFKRLCDRLL